MSAKRFNFLCNKFLVDSVSFDTLNISAPLKTERITITVDRNSSFKSKRYAPGELDSLVDSIDNVEF